jgi:hypothetical protein
MTGKNGAPSHFIDPKQKNDSWIRDYLRYIYDAAKTANADMFWGAKDRYHRNRLYAHGDQPTAKYRKGLKEPEDAKVSWLTIDEQVLAFMPKIRRMALSKLNQVGYDIVATPVDALAQEEKEMYEAKVRTNIQLKQALSGLPGLNPNDLQDAPDEPQTEEELDIKMKWGWKHNTAIEMEQWIDTVRSHNNYPEIEKGIKQCLFDYGAAAVREYADENDAIKLKLCKPERMIVGYSEERNFKDAAYIGEIIQPTIGEVKEQIGDAISESEWEDIAGKYSGKLGNPDRWYGYTNGGFDYDECRIEVFDGSFQSVNERVSERRVTKEGNKIVGKTSYKKKDKDSERYKSQAYQVWYQGKWIIGSDYVYNAGLMNDMVRPKARLQDALPPFHVFVPEFYNGKSYSIMDQCIPIIDEICIDWFRLQNAKAQARPDGIAIDVQALNETAFSGGGGEGGKYEPAELLDMFEKRGILVFKMRDDEGNILNKPIHEIRGGLGETAMRWFEQIKANMNMLREIIGFNEISDGSSVDPRMLNGVADKMFESTNVALQHIIDGEKSISLSVANNICIRIQNMAKKGRAEVYRYAMGKESIERLKNNPKATQYEFAIKLEDKPTDEDRQWLEENVAQLLANKQIDLRSASIVRNTDNLKLAEQLLAFYQKRYEDEQHQRSVQLQEQNAKVQSESNQAAEQAKQQTQQLKTQGELELEKLRGENAIRQIQEKLKADIQLAEINNEGKLEVKVIENEGKEDVAQINQIARQRQQQQAKTATP